jgi:hypothetical protein
MSRAHANKSEKFKKKKETRSKREYERRVLRKAQEIYRVRFGEPLIKNIDMKRDEILKIKKEVKEQKLIDSDDSDYNDE